MHERRGDSSVTFFPARFSTIVSWLSLTHIIEFEDRLKSQLDRHFSATVRRGVRRGN